MKTDAFIISIQYYEETTTPSVIILIRSEVQMQKMDEQEQKIFSSFKTFIKSFGQNIEQRNYHKSSIILTLDQYRKSNFKVGDRLEFDISVNNIGDEFQE